MADPVWDRLKTALDQVSGQRDCHASRLFWYTDLEQAKAAAAREHKPILSLRLLGKLTDEYSCANSRFFRTTLYANDAVSQVLRDRFILHWKSVRPVPKVTIDFGDGRKLERTLTGNSIHYVLDADGQVIDALPGLYGPKPFLREIERAEKIVQQAATLPAVGQERLLMVYHRERADAIQAAWQEDLAKLGVQLAQPGRRAESAESAGCRGRRPCGSDQMGRGNADGRCGQSDADAGSKSRPTRSGIGSRRCTPKTAHWMPPASL